MGSKVEGKQSQLATVLRFTAGNCKKNPKNSAQQCLLGQIFLFYFIYLKKKV